MTCILIIFFLLLTLVPGLPASTDDGLRAKAEKGDPDAMCLLARQLLKDSRKNDDRFAVGAAFWFHSAAEKGSPEGMFCYGALVYSGRGAQKDPAKACAWFEKAAAKGSLPAKLKLALIDYAGIPEDKLTRYPGRKALPGYALFQLRELSDRGYVPAKVAYVRILSRSKDEGMQKEMLRILEEAERDPDAPSELIARLASCCDEGKLIRQDSSRALSLYRRAAKARDPEALYLLAKFYEMGHIVKQDPAKSRNLYSISARLGHGAALYRMGEFAEEKKDFKNAFQYFTASMKAKYPAAASKLGHMYLDGIGTDPSEYQAFSCFFEGAAIGDTESQYMLGKGFYEGKGLPVDHTAASYWLAQAALHGHAPAQYLIGKCYLEGDCNLPRSITKGEEWLKKAAAAQYGPAIRLLQRRRL